MKLRVMFRKLPYAPTNAKQLKRVPRQCEPYNHTNVMLCICINRLLITLLISYVYERALVDTFNAMTFDVWSTEIARIFNSSNEFFISKQK